MDNIYPGTPPDRPTPDSSPQSRFPLSQEQKILDRLIVLDLQGAKDPLSEVSQTLGRVEPRHLNVARLYTFDLLASINRLVWKGRASESRREENRRHLVASISAVESPIDLRRVFDRLLSLILSPFGSSTPNQHPSISRAKVYIQESCHRKISLREVAAHLGLSRTYLSSLFRRECGCTLTEYLHRVRIQRAEQLIRAGTASLSAVATRVGYQNYRDFHRNFVRYQNASPKRFKRQVDVSSLPPGASHPPL